MELGDRQRDRADRPASFWSDRDMKDYCREVMAEMGISGKAGLRKIRHLFTAEDWSWLIKNL